MLEAAERNNSWNIFLEFWVKIRSTALESLGGVPMSMETDLLPLEPLLDDLDAICRHGFGVYRGYPAEVLVEHDARAAASCTYMHILAETDRRFLGRSGIVSLDIKGLKVWNIGDQAVIRFKRMDEDGRSRNYPTDQARKFDLGHALPGLPPPATRLTVGYWLDPSQSEYMRTQIAKPRGRGLPEWCAAIITETGGRKRWIDVTRQGGWAG